MKKVNLSSPPNIFVTNFCNQKCPSCYASELMYRKNSKKEIAIKDFEILVSKMKKIDIQYIKLLGGEPTLHSQFETILKLSSQNFRRIHIFSNGLFNEKIYQIIHKYLDKLSFTFNISTPSFQFNKQAREKVINNIYAVSISSSVSISVLIDNLTLPAEVVQIIPKALIKKIHCIRLGLLNPLAGKKNTYLTGDFKKIGNNLYQIVTLFKHVNPELTFVADCGITRCMFTNEQYNYLVNNGVKFVYWGCFLGRFVGHFDIQTDLNTVSCYSLSGVKLNNLRNESILKTQNKAFLNQYLLQKEYSLEQCQKCKFYGTSHNKCTGPCLGFRKNLIMQTPN